MGNVLSGIAAGGVGTSLLNTATYVDMAVRGRQSSSLPAADAERLSDRAGVSLGGDEQSASARKEGLGALTPHRLERGRLRPGERNEGRTAPL